MKNLWNLHLLFVTVSSCISCVGCGNILVILIPLGSHVRSLLPALEELKTSYGHQAYVIGTDDLKSMPLLSNSSVSVIVSDHLNDFDFTASFRRLMDAAFNGTKSTWLENLRDVTHMCDLLLTDRKLVAELKNLKFDIAIVEKTILAMCFNILPYKLSVPFVHIGRSVNPVYEGVPSFPSFVYSGYAHTMEVSDRMTFAQRLINTFLFLIQIVYPDPITPRRAVEKYVPEKPYLSTIDLWKQAELTLLDADPVIDYPRPIMPNYIFVGGIGARSAGSLDKTLTDFINSGPEGVVVVSFGSLATDFPLYITDKFLKTFKKFEHLRFVFKQGSVTDIQSNVLTMPWIPQNDLLGHPKVLLFITHCGNAGQFEALYHGIPMVGFPLFADQHYNCKRMETRGFGVKMNIHDFTVGSLEDNIKKILFQEQYKQSIRKASVVFRNRIDKPSERAAFWIDHVIKFGGKYMRPASIDMPLYQYFLVDVTLVIVFTFLAVCVICYIAIRKIFRHVKERNAKVKAE